MIDSSTEPEALADVDVGIVRAAFGVAETGSVWLSEKELTTNALAYLAQHLVVLLDPEQIEATSTRHIVIPDLRLLAMPCL